MSDQNSYINTYVDHAVGMIHEQVNAILQLRTQLSLANGLVSQKDEVISSLQAEQEKAVSALQLEKDQATASLQAISDQNNNANQELNTARENATKWENEFNAMKSKITHMESLSNQCVEMKHALQQKNEEIENLTKELEKRQEFDKIVADLEEARKKIERLTKKEEKKSSTAAPKKDINKETTPLSVPSPKPEATVAKPIVVEKKVIEETDDF